MSPETLERTIDGVTLRLANLTAEIGRRHWNLGVVGADGRVEWVESGSTRADVEAYVETVVKNELERRRGKPLIEIL